jgi:DNA-directed RNA polymerase subunit E'/Rpb7
MDSDGHVIGVCQVMNKLNGRVFTEDDVAIIEVCFLLLVFID